MSEVVFRVQRFRPERDDAPFWQEYRLEVRPWQTVLDALIELRARQDGSLAFRGTCRSGTCGACAMSVDGQPALACEATLGQPARTGRLELAPLPRFRVLCDLVVDEEPFFTSVRQATPWLLARAEHDGRLAPAVVARLQPVSACVLCGICQANRSSESSSNPASLARLYTRALDPRDALGPARLAQARDLGLLDLALPADDRLGCPKGIDFGGQVLPDLRGLDMVAR